MSVHTGYYADYELADIEHDLQARGHQPLFITEHPDTHLDEHTHEASHILVIVRGVMQLTLNGKEHDMYPGDSVTIPPRTRHGAQFGPEGCAYLWVEF